jgi:hypothetical protein
MGGDHGGKGSLGGSYGDHGGKSGFGASRCGQLTMEVKPTLVAAEVTMETKAGSDIRGHN